MIIRGLNQIGIAGLFGDAAGRQIHTIAMHGHAQSFQSPIFLLLWISRRQDTYLSSTALEAAGQAVDTVLAASGKIRKKSFVSD